MSVLQRANIKSLEIIKEFWTRIESATSILEAVYHLPENERINHLTLVSSQIEAASQATQDLGVLMNAVIDHVITLTSTTIGGENNGEVGSEHQESEGQQDDTQEQLQRRQEDSTEGQG